MPFDGLFLTPELRAAVSDEAWVRAMVRAEAALLKVQFDEALAEVELDSEDLARDGQRVGNPAEPLVRRLREVAPNVHHGATSQDVLDTAAAIVVRDAKALVLRELDGAASAAARLAEHHRDTVMPARTLLQQAVPTTFGLKASIWLAGLMQVGQMLDAAHVPAQLGGAGGTLAAFRGRGLEVRDAFARELGLPAPAVTWHTLRLPIANVGALLGMTAGLLEKIALDVQLLAQTEVGEVREPAEGGSSTMPHKRNPVGSALARACAMRARSAASLLQEAMAQEHERGAGGWHAEWGALSDALAYTGAAASWVRQTLDGLEVDAKRMRANLIPETLSEAERFGGAERPEEYLGSAGALVDAAVAAYRERMR